MRGQQRAAALASYSVFRVRHAPMITPTKPLVEIRPNVALERRSKQVERVKGWRFNWRLLFTTLAIFSVGSPLIYFWRGYQVNRNASALLVLADQDEQRKEWGKAAEQLYRYLQLRPSDVETIVRMAED